MQAHNIGRLVCVGILAAVAIALFLIQKFVYKDIIIEHEGASLVQLRKYERSKVTVINIVVSWYIGSVGVAQPWTLLEVSTFAGVLVSIIAFMAPFAMMGGGFFGFRLQKNDFDWLLIMEANTEKKIFKLWTVECFSRDGIRYVKAETASDAMNENFFAILIDVERDRFWKAELNGLRLEPVFSESIIETNDALLIETFMKEGAVITTALLEANTEREVHKQASLKKIISEQEADIMLLEDENNYLKAQRKKGILEQTAERWAVIQKVIRRCEGTLPDEDLASIIDDEAAEADAVLAGLEDIPESD